MSRAAQSDGRVPPRGDRPAVRRLGRDRDRVESAGDTGEVGMDGERAAILWGERAYGLGRRPVTPLGRSGRPELAGASWSDVAAPAEFFEELSRAVQESVREEGAGGEERGERDLEVRPLDGLLEQ